MRLTVPIAYDLRYDTCVRPVLKDDQVSRAAILKVAEARAGYAEYATGRQCRPTNGRLAADTGLSVRTVQRADVALRLGIAAIAYTVKYPHGLIGFRTGTLRPPTRTARPTRTPSATASSNASSMTSCARCRTATCPKSTPSRVRPGTHHGTTHPH